MVISTTGVLYRIYPGRLNQGLSNSVVRIGDVIDTDAYRGSLAESGEVTFTSFEAADFDAGERFALRGGYRCY